MHIIKKKAIVDFYTRYPEAKPFMERWYSITKRSQWKNFSDIKKDFNAVDAAGIQHYIFNIKGNDYRIIVVIQFLPGFVFIRFVGTHAEYDRIKDASTI